MGQRQRSANAAWRSPRRRANSARGNVVGQGGQGRRTRLSLSPTPRALRRLPPPYFPAAQGGTAPPQHPSGTSPGSNMVPDFAWLPFCWDCATWAACRPPSATVAAPGAGLQFCLLRTGTLLPGSTATKQVEQHGTWARNIGHMGIRSTHSSPPSICEPDGLLRQLPLY